MTSIIEEHQTELAEFCVRFRVTRLAVFGSAATGTFDSKRSDIDLLVEFESLTPGEHADAYFGLLEALERLFGLPVDLVEPEPIRNPYLKRTIDETLVVIYDAA